MTTICLQGVPFLVRAFFLLLECYCLSSYHYTTTSTQYYIPYIGRLSSIHDEQIFIFSHNHQRKTHSPIKSRAGDAHIRTYVSGITRFCKWKFNSCQSYANLVNDALAKCGASHTHTHTSRPPVKIDMLVLGVARCSFA